MSDHTVAATTTPAQELSCVTYAAGTYDAADLDVVVLGGVDAAAIIITDGIDECSYTQQATGELLIDPDDSIGYNDGTIMLGAAALDNASTRLEGDNAVMTIINTDDPTKVLNIGTEDGQSFHFRLSTDTESKVSAIGTGTTNTPMSFYNDGTRCGAVFRNGLANTQTVLDPSAVLQIDSSFPFRLPFIAGAPPATAATGAMFYRTSAPRGVYIYNGFGWYNI